MLRTLLAGIGVLAIITVSAAGLHAYGGYRDYDERLVRLRVSPAGLDLTTREGLDLLDVRIKRAINRICGGYGMSSLSFDRSEQQCRDDAWAGTRPQVARAIARAEHRLHFAARRGFREDAISADLDRQAPSMRAALYRALDDAVRSGRDSPWQTWRDHGWVVLNQPAMLDDLRCSTISIVRQDDGPDDVVTQGIWCLAPDGSTGPLPGV